MHFLMKERAGSCFIFISLLYSTKIYLVPAYSESGTFLGDISADKGNKRLPAGLELAFWQGHADNSKRRQ